MSIKMKILIPMIMLTIISGAAVLISDIFQFSGYVDESLNESITIASSVAVGELENIKTKAHTVSWLIASDNAIIEALETGDSAALQERASQLFADTDVDFCTVTNAFGTALARPHKPEMLGDDVSAIPSIKSALSGKGLTTVEQGVSIRLSACSGLPIYDNQDNLVGAVSSGYRLDTDKFVDSIKNLVKSEVTVFLADERISTTVVKADGTRAIGTNAAANVSQTVLSGKVYRGQAKILDHDALTSYTPITGADGKVLGMLFVGRYLDEKTETVKTFINNSMLIMLALLAISTPVILLIAKRIITPVRTMVHAARALAAGDTEIDVQTNTNDETRELADAFNDMTKNIRQQTQTIAAIAEGDFTVSVTARSEKDLMNNTLITMITLNNDVFSQLVGTAEQVASGSRQIADGSESLAQGATEQAASVEQLLTIIDKVDNEVRDNAAMAEKAACLTSEITVNAKKGSEQMQRMVRAAKDINESSQSISNIINAIEDIAFQTNILALNASVEAARAGQHGKGFAVVADEVRNLAYKSAEAAKSTTSLIENSIIKTELGVKIADDAASFLNEIVAGIDESGHLVSKIAAVSEQQSAAMSQMSIDIKQVSQVIQANSAAAEESAAASVEMSAQASTLKKLVSQFKLR